MPREYYDNVTFEILQTTGEAELFFGKTDEIAALPKDKRPTISFSVDADGTAVVTLRPNGIRPCRPFNSTAIYVGPLAEEWLDSKRDLIIGHVDLGYRCLQQLFLMWVRLSEESDYPGVPPAKPLRLSFFFFDRENSVSSGLPIDNLEGSAGQATGGGCGHGPN